MRTTGNEPAVIDAGEFSVRRSITIEASVDKVWSAITEPEHLAQWFPQQATLESLEVGANGVFTFEGYGAFPVVIEQLDPKRSITYRWSNENARPVSPVDLQHSTVFCFTLEPVEHGTQLTVVESGFDNLADPMGSMEGNRSGWNSELDELIAYLETAP